MIYQGEIPKIKDFKVAVITARFNEDITYRLEMGAMRKLQEAGVPREQITQMRVPGAFEIPLAAKYAYDMGAHAIVALGAVIRGDTSHYDYVCSAVERGCTELQLRYAIPVAFGVLTTDNEEQALDRAGGSHGNKGEEAASVALEMLDLKHRLMD
tara:strand:- start:5740 stop:6204 length:465 start_codon:yes stop_codon:yes gene_type:complete